MIWSNFKLYYVATALYYHLLDFMMYVICNPRPNALSHNFNESVNSVDISSMTSIRLRYQMVLPTTLYHNENWASSFPFILLTTKRTKKITSKPSQKHDLLGRINKSNYLATKYLDNAAKVENFLRCGGLKKWRFKHPPIVGSNIFVIFVWLLLKYSFCALIVRKNKNPQCESDSHVWNADWLHCGWAQ